MPDDDGRERYHDFTYDDILRLAAELEEGYRLFCPPGRQDALIRDERDVLDALSSFSNHEFQIFEEDLYAKNKDSDQSHNEAIEPPSHDVFSICMLYETPTRRRAEIWINTFKTKSGPLVNRCWKRFCKTKEACQAVIKHTFTKREWAYSASDSVTKTIVSVDDLLTKRFSFDDFQGTKYPFSVRIENAAELLAILLLYPIERMIADRRRIIDEVGEDSMRAYDYFDTAERYLVPRRYVFILLNSPDLGQIEAMMQPYRSRGDI